MIATTVGIVTKNEPFATPFSMTKTTRRPTLVEKGHKASMLIALRAMVRRKVLVGPILSQSGPERSLPTAVQALKPATRPAPTPDDSPTERAIKGRKYGGTNRVNVASAAAIDTAV